MKKRNFRNNNIYINFFLCVVKRGKIYNYRYIYVIDEFEMS